MRKIIYNNAFSRFTDKEFDEKYADVIVKRYAEMGKEDIKLLRNGKTYSWNEVKNQLYAGDVT